MIVREELQEVMYVSLDKTTKPSNFEILKELAKQSQEEQKSRRAKSVKRINVNIKLLIMIFVYTTSLFVTALKEFVSSDMNWAYLGTSEFISNMLFSTLNNFFILLAVFIYALDKLKKSKFFLDLVALIKENVEKLTSMIDSAAINTITVMIMEVPCCGGLVQMAKKALSNASRKVPLKLMVVGIQGNIISEDWV